MIMETERLILRPFEEGDAEDVFEYLNEPAVRQYVLPKALCLDEINDDSQAGYEFTFSKMKRMREKMLDHKEFYTFDVFEEKLLFSMCSIDADRARTLAGRKKREPLKEKVEATSVELREKYKLTARDANDYSRKMYYTSAILLKDSEEENLIFWDYDHIFSGRMDL